MNHPVGCILMTVTRLRFLNRFLLAKMCFNVIFEVFFFQKVSKSNSDWKSSQNDVNSIAGSTTTNGDVNPESTVVIRRKSIRPNPNEGVAEAILKEDPYGRATNMRMTSFMDAKGILSQSSSATLPHYPTQPTVQNVFSNCSTMPLPQHTSANIPQPIANGNRYKSFFK